MRSCPEGTFAPLSVSSGSDVSHHGKGLFGTDAKNHFGHDAYGGSFSISLSQTPRYEASVEQHAEVLELRKRDAQIGMETCWVALNTLANELKSGNPVLPLSIM